MIDTINKKRKNRKALRNALDVGSSILVYVVDLKIVTPCGEKFSSNRDTPHKE